MGKGALLAAGRRRLLATRIHDWLHTPVLPAEGDQQHAHTSVTLGHGWMYAEAARVSLFVAMMVVVQRPVVVTAMSQTGPKSGCCTRSLAHCAAPLSRRFCSSCFALKHARIRSGTTARDGKRALKSPPPNSASNLWRCVGPLQGRQVDRGRARTRVSVPLVPPATS